MSEKKMWLEKDSDGQNNNSKGVVIPPPDITSMVDKAARFVASIKPRLEKFIAMNAGMRKYTFLNAAHPYHAYYQHRLSEFRAQNGSAAAHDKTWPRALTDKNAALIQSILESHERFEKSAAVSDTVVVSPITGELVAFTGMLKQMRDPKYKQQKERLFAKIRETTTLAQDDDIATSIFMVARFSPDSLGTTHEEVCNAVKAQIENTSHALFSDESLLGDEFLDQVQIPEISVESLSERFEREDCWRD